MTSSSWPITTHHQGTDKDRAYHIRRTCFILDYIFCFFAGSPSRNLLLRCTAPWRTPFWRVLTINLKPRLMLSDLGLVVNSTSLQDIYAGHRISIGHDDSSTLSAVAVVDGIAGIRESIVLEVCSRELLEL